MAGSKPSLAYDSAGAGPAVVFLHGLGGFRQIWRSQIPAVVGGGFSSVAIDLPGHGASGDEREVSIKGMAEAVLSTLDSLGLARVALVGHSMGGRVMFQLAVDDPDRVWAVVAVGAQSEAPRGEYRMTIETIKTAAVEGGLEGFRSAFAEAGEIPALADRDPEFGIWYRGHFDNNRPESLVKALGAILSMPTLTSRLGAIVAPALCVVGSEDAPFLPFATRYESTMRDCRTAIIEGCRHYPMVDAAAIFNKALCDFLIANRPEEL